MNKFNVKTKTRIDLYDITDKVKALVSESKIKEGFVAVYVPHTTAAVTINENYDPSVVNDINTILSKLIPESSKYQHTEGNADAHIKASIIGSSRLIIINGGKLQLGRWQGIFFCEFDGPRNREVWIKIIEGR